MKMRAFGLCVLWLSFLLCLFSAVISHELIHFVADNVILAVKAVCVGIHGCTCLCMA